MNSTRLSTFKQKSFTMESLPRPTSSTFRGKKEKVVFVVGPTGTGKSRLAIDLATRFPAEVVNCDKMQVYKGLDVATNKVTDAERRGVPHHLLGVIHDPLADFAAADFCHCASRVAKSIIARGRLPIVAGGSNSFVEALVDGEDAEFRSQYDFCFLWVDVALPVLYEFISDRVDRMVDSGLVEEVRAAFDPNDRDYTRGIRRAIGVPELDEYFRSGGRSAALMEAAVEKIKENTCRLAYRQLKKIQRLNGQLNWSMHRVDATEVFLRSGTPEADEIWEELVAGPSAVIVDRFLQRDENSVSKTTEVVEDHAAAVGIPLPAMAAAARLTL